ASAIYRVSLHDALPISISDLRSLRAISTESSPSLLALARMARDRAWYSPSWASLSAFTRTVTPPHSGIVTSSYLMSSEPRMISRSEEHTSELQSRENLV